MADWQTNQQEVIDGLYAQQQRIERDPMPRHLMPSIDQCIRFLRAHYGVGSEIIPTPTTDASEEELEARVNTAIHHIVPIAEGLREEALQLLDTLENAFEEQGTPHQKPHVHAFTAATAYAGARGIHYGLDPRQKRGFDDAVQLRKQAENLFLAYKRRIKDQSRKGSGFRF
ncbi:MAG: hypothetical protein ACMXYM_03710 [Candidatus Woesearchaeota archaeon]